MAWSLPFTGKRSIVTDSYQRLALNFSIDDIANSKIQQSIFNLSQWNMLHLSISTTEENFRGNKATTVLNNLQSLSSLIAQIEKNLEPGVIPEENGSAVVSVAHQPKRFFLSLHIPHHVVDFVKAITTLSYSFDLLIIHVGGNKPTAMNNLISVHDILDMMKLPTSLGLGGCLNNIELDWYLTKIPSHMLKLVHLGEIHLPNLKLHSIELVHTLSYNSMFTVTTNALLHEFVTYPALLRISEKYSVAPDTVLLKAVLQLGCIVCLPFDENNVNTAYVQEHFSRLCHPFVHRRNFVSSNKIITLQIASDDMAVLTEASDEYEASESDANWMPHAHGRSPDRDLTYHK